MRTQADVYNYLNDPESVKPDTTHRFRNDDDGSISFYVEDDKPVIVEVVDNADREYYQEDFTQTHRQLASNLYHAFIKESV